MNGDEARAARARLRRAARNRRHRRRQRRGDDYLVVSSESEQNSETSEESANDSGSADEMVHGQQIAENGQGAVNEEEQLAEGEQNAQGEVHEEEQLAEGVQNAQGEVHEEVQLAEGEQNAQGEVHEEQVADNQNQAGENNFANADNDADSDDDREYFSQGEGSSSESHQSEEESEGPEESDNNEEDSDEENHDGNQDGDQLIYPGAPITLHQSLLAIFTLMSVEHLSGKLVESILQLIALHCPEGSIVKKTLYKFKAYFARIGESVIVFHYFCSDCIYPLQSKNSVCPKCQKTNVSYFLELPLIQQLQNLYNKPFFFQDLQFRFREDRKQHAEHIADIYDGEVYTEQMRNGFLSNENNISFMWYSDGISIFKSSGFSIWPLCLVINELPYKLRTLPHNILLVGLWFGKSKPNPNVFLRPLYRTMNNFETNGHDFKLPDGSEINVKGKVLCGTCDLPAKCKFMQFKQYNSYFGCPKCLAEGGRTDAGKGTAHVYPYNANIQNRTHQQSLEFAAQALQARRNDRKASVCGVKGPTLLSKIVPDLIRCTAIDGMHGNFLGNCRTLMDLWFSSTFSSRPWSVHHLFDVADEKIRKIKSPSFTQRSPRSLKEIKFWKASEFKLFMIYYSVPVLKNVLDEVYFKHHCLLVSGISLLSQDSISLGQVQAASDMLTSYVSDFARLYPLRYLGLNLHQLVHLSDSVIELGPLWVTSCFFLENYNGKINKFFHGTQHVALQVCSTVAMYMKLPLLKSNLPPESEVMKFCLNIENQSKAVKIADQIDHCTYAVGTYSIDQLRESANIVRRRMDIENGSCTVFHRLKRKGVIFFAQEYSRISKAKESSFILFEDDDDVNKIGRIIRFVRWSHCRNICDVGCRNCQASFYAIVRIFQRQLWFIHQMRDVRLPYMFKVEPTEEIKAIEVRCILGLCFYIEANNEQYVATAVNRLEVE